jgi:acyl carrier protein
MGLDGVEMVMKVEETFDIAIENSEAEQIVAPGQLIELVLSKVGRTDHAACLTQRAFHRLRASLTRRMGFDRKEIKPETKLASLFPRATRKADARRMETDLGMRRKLDFFRPSWLTSWLVGSTFFGGVAVGVFIKWRPISSASLPLDLAFGSPIVAGALFMIFFGWAGFFMTRWMAVEFEPAVKTVGDLSRWIVATSPEVVGAPPGAWSREQVEEVVRRIVIDTLGCEKQYRADARFVEDLRMS